MLRNLIIMLLCSTFSQFLKAQEIKGSVADRATSQLLARVQITNLTTKQKVETSSKGVFTINASPGQVLTFYQPGYLIDTLLLIDSKPLKRYLYLNTNMLKNVTIKGDAFNPEVMYADVYRKAKYLKFEQNTPLTFYPSKYFSKEGKDARRAKRYLENEKIERQIDARFNEKLVSAVTALKGDELDNFMVLYRPTLKKLSKLDKDDLMMYVMNAYKEYKLLPVEKRTSPLQQYLNKNLQPDSNNKGQDTDQDQD